MSFSVSIAIDHLQSQEILNGVNLQVDYVNTKCDDVYALGMQFQSYRTLYVALSYCLAICKFFSTFVFTIHYDFFHSWPFICFYSPGQKLDVKTKEIKCFETSEGKQKSFKSLLHVAIQELLTLPVQPVSLPWERSHVALNVMIEFWFQSELY